MKKYYLESRSRGISYMKYVQNVQGGKGVENYKGQVTGSKLPQ
jgi:hypothetical protein